MEVLTKEFYTTGHVTDIAKNLLGCILWTNVEGKISAGTIVEVEAYSGINDKACHANNGRRTKRNEVMYGPGGVAYVYLCYGIHNMFNVVTGHQDNADAVLIRAIEPYEGQEHMLRRKDSNSLHRIGAGPGNVCKVLGIELIHNGSKLDESQIWITSNKKIAKEEITSTTRIGVEYAKEDALLPWRFYITGSPAISKK